VFIVVIEHNAQFYLDKNYPAHIRDKTESITIWEDPANLRRDRNVTSGSISLKDFKNLIKYIIYRKIFMLWQLLFLNTY
jgi:hypothetical protein